MPRKILFFIGGSYVSGVEVITLHLISELKKNGNEVHCIISGWNDGVFKAKLLALGVSFDEVKLGWIYITKPKWTLDTLFNYPAAVATCRKVMRQFNPDVCHFCYYGVIIILYPFLKKNCVFGLHDPDQPTFKHRLFYSIIKKKAGILTGVSKYIAGVLKNLNVPEEKIRLIYNGVPLKVFSPRPAYGARLIFGIIGQIVYWKGHENLISAVDLLVRDGQSNFEVLIFGNDKNDYAGKLRQMIKEKNLDSYFSWRGFVTEQEKIYDAVDVVIVPSLSQEPCSLSIIESMMSAKAVIVSDRGGNVELVEHEVTGLVFPATEPAALKKSMELLLTDRPRIGYLAEAAYKKASTELTVSRMTKEYELVYDEVIKKLMN